MSEQPSRCDTALVELLAVLETSLLHYVSESGLWTDAEHAGATATIERLAGEQHRSAADVAELLARRHLLPEMVNFPSEFAQYHYLAMTFVLDRVIENQEKVVAIAADAVTACELESVAGVLRDVCNCERANLVELQRLSDEIQNRRPIEQQAATLRSVSS